MSAQLRDAGDRSTGSSLTWGYAIGTGVLCGLLASLVMATVVGVTFSVDAASSRVDETTGTAILGTLAAGAAGFMLASIVATVIGVPAGAVLGAANKALVQRSATRVVPVTLAIVLATASGALLPVLLLNLPVRSWYPALAALSAAVAAEVHVSLALRRAARATRPE